MYAKAEKKIFAVDVGGTSTRFGTFLAGRRVDGTLELRREGSAWIESNRAQRFSELFAVLFREEKLAFAPEDADFVSIAAAGPVRDGRYCQLTNLPWEIDLVAAASEVGFRDCALMNDLVAQAFSTRTDARASAQLVCGGEADPVGTIAVVAPGTGLGKAALVSRGDGGYSAIPSEGGHSQFVIESEEELAFARFVAQKSGLRHATWEEVISGQGLPHLSAFLLGETLAPEAVGQRFSSEPKLLEWMTKFLARACRNFAMELLSTGGVFLAGGIPVKNPQLVTSELFEREFRSVAKHQALFDRMPVWMITDQESALWGGAYAAAQSLGLVGEPLPRPGGE